MSTVAATAAAVGRRALYGDRLCSACLLRSTRQSTKFNGFPNQSLSRRTIHNGPLRAGRASGDATVASQFIQDYFSTNGALEQADQRPRIWSTFQSAAQRPQTESNDPRASGAILDRSVMPEDAGQSLKHIQSPLMPPPGTTNAASMETDVLPHRRRRRRKAVDIESSEEELPLDASNQLTTAAASLPASATFRRKFATYLSLSKPRLSFLILLTTTSAYSLFPIDPLLASTASAATTSFSTSQLTLLFLSAGTFLSCCCANTLNMLYEPKTDAMMSRTANRPLVRKLVSPRAAAVFAVLCGASGLLLLNYGTNPTVAGLSALNIFLYAGVYTPMKQLHVANTWVGAIVGGIPPLMGWAAASGETATSEHHGAADLLLSESSVGAWCLAGLLYAWQFPHFMSLSHGIREDYKRAGHQMLAWTNPARNARVALRYSIAMFPICGAMYWYGVVDPSFLVISTACNTWMLREAYRFWKHTGARGSAKGLFWASVWHLPLVLVGALVCKKGLWDGFFSKEEPISIYESDGEETLDADLNMRTKSPPPDINLAMMGFKRPT
jgi:heme o synthase